MRAISYARSCLMFVERAGQFLLTSMNDMDLLDSIFSLPGSLYHTCLIDDVLPCVLIIMTIA